MGGLCDRDSECVHFSIHTVGDAVKSCGILDRSKVSAGSWVMGFRGVDKQELVNWLMACLLPPALVMVRLQRVNWLAVFNRIRQVA